MTSDYYEAVLFFNEQGVVKEMRYSEFEAVLDNMVGIPEFAGTQVKAGYIMLTYGLQITSCVMFLMGFDQKGNADQEWNIPLRHLASRGGPGPNLGAGPIRLACRSQCSIAWHQSELWEPQEKGNFDPFITMSRAIIRNKLGFKKIATADVDEDIPLVSDIVVITEPSKSANIKNQEEVTRAPETHKKHKRELAKVRAEADRKLGALEHQHQEEVDQIIRAYRNEKLTLQEELRSLHHKLREQTVFHETVKTKYLDLQAKSNEWRGEVVLYKDQLTALQNSLNQLVLEKSQQHGSLEAQDSALQLELVESKAFLDTERLEVARLKQVLYQTESEKRIMVKAFIEQLKSLDVLFVAYHLGAGHISLTADQLTDYLDNPEYFAAQKCKVSLPQYQAWVTHFESPTCEICQEAIPRISLPADFVVGKHQFCHLHKPNM